VKKERINQVSRGEGGLTDEMADAGGFAVSPGAGKHESVEGG
jgi:hypothetical protein